MTSTKFETKPLFTRQQLTALLLPLIAEQALSVTIGLADTLMVSSVGEAAVSAVSLVDSMLDDVRRHEFPGLYVSAPFRPDTPCEQVWETLRSCARPPMPLVSVFRFLRIAPPSEKPYVDHWTVGHYMDMEGLHFLDCSLEAGALYCLPYAKLTDPWRPLSREYVVIPPESVRILSVSRSAGLPG